MEEKKVKKKRRERGSQIRVSPEIIAVSISGEIETGTKPRIDIIHIKCKTCPHLKFVI